ncbi:MAG: enoyl-CoA hydratase/isomerase family protein [Nocardioides sp.]
MADHSVHTSSGDGVARVEFDNATRGNCFTEDALADLVAALEEAAARPETSAVRLVMAGRHFSAGWDTADFARLRAASPAEVSASLRANDRQLARIRDLPVPVVTSVHGRVAGFGVGLLAHVHVPVSSHDATLALPEAAFGICPGGVLHTLLHTVPRPAVELLALSGAHADATDMLQWGLVASIAPPDRADERADEIAAAIAAQPPGIARRIHAATAATLEAASPEPAYAAAAASITGGETS